MIVLGILLWLVGLLAGIGVLQTVGIILIVIGVILLLLGSAGTEIGGRRYWY